MALSFLQDRQISARDEWGRVLSVRPKETIRIFAHLAAVDAAGHAADNRPLSHAFRIPSSGEGPDLYCYEILDVGVVYAYDGENVIILAIALLDNREARDALIRTAQQRVQHV